MGKKLYVGGLPFSMTEDQLHSLLASCGEVASTKLMTDSCAGRSRGCGFVEMSDDAGAAAAIQKLNGTLVEGRQIVVAEVRPKSDRKQHYRDRGSFGRQKGGQQRGGFNRW